MQIVNKSEIHTASFKIAILIHCSIKWHLDQRPIAKPKSASERMRRLPGKLRVIKMIANYKNVCFTKEDKHR